MNEIRAIFLDFDWTLFDHKVRNYNFKALEGLNEVHKKGVKLIINSARSYYALKNLKAFELIPFDGFVTSNGGLASYNNKEIYSYTFSGSLKHDFLTFLDKTNFSYLLITKYKTFIKIKNKDIVDDFYKVFYEPFPLDISSYKGEDILAIQVFLYENEEKELKDFVVKNNLFYNRFTDNNVEITLKEFSKDEGIKAVINEAKFDRNEIMAFGDDLNDIPMFKYVKYGICLGNGKEEAKKYAYFVTDNIEDDGIYNALKKFNLID